MRHIFWIIPILLIAAAVPLAAAPGDAVRNRIAGFRALGAAFKAANDIVRAGDFRSARLEQAARQIASAGRKQYQWFPAGSGPRSRVKTAAKPEIWSRSREFRAAQDAFVRQAATFERVVATGNEAAIRKEVRRLGAKCKGCHDDFRVSDD